MTTIYFFTDKAFYILGVNFVLKRRFVYEELDTVQINYIDKVILVQSEENLTLKPFEHFNEIADCFTKNLPASLISSVGKNY